MTNCRTSSSTTAPSSAPTTSTHSPPSSTLSAPLPPSLPRIGYSEVPTSPDARRAFLVDIIHRSIPQRHTVVDLDQWVLDHKGVHTLMITPADSIDKLRHITDASSRLRVIACLLYTHHAEMEDDLNQVLQPSGTWRTGLAFSLYRTLLQLGQEGGDHSVPENVWSSAVAWMEGQQLARLPWLPISSVCNPHQWNVEVEKGNCHVCGVENDEERVVVRFLLEDQSNPVDVNTELTFTCLPEEWHTAYSFLGFAGYPGWTTKPHIDEDDHIQQQADVDFPRGGVTGVDSIQQLEVRSGSTAVHDLVSFLHLPLITPVWLKWSICSPCEPGPDGRHFCLQNAGCGQRRHCTHCTACNTGPTCRCRTCTLRRNLSRQCALCREMGHVMFCSACGVAPPPSEEVIIVSDDEEEEKEQEVGYTTPPPSAFVLKRRAQNIARVDDVPVPPHKRRSTSPGAAWWLGDESDAFEAALEEEKVAVLSGDHSSIVLARTKRVDAERVYADAAFTVHGAQVAFVDGMWKDVGGTPEPLLLLLNGKRAKTEE